MSDAKIVISADSSQAIKAFHQVSTGAEKLKSELSSLNKATGVLGSSFATLMTAGVALGAISIGASIVKETAAIADEMGKAAQKVGTTTEALSGLRYAADLAGVNFEQLQTGMEKLAKSSEDFSDGSKSAQEAFAKINLDPSKFSDSADLFEAVATQLSKMPDGAEKTAIAMELFGKAGANLIPLLNGGSEGIKQMRDEAEKLGLIMSKEDAAAAEEFNDNMTRLGKTVDGLKFAFGKRMLPALQEISAAMAQTARESGILSALWVGLGGAATHILGIGESTIAAAAKIEKADNSRAIAMEKHSATVIKAKELELRRLEAVFEAQKKGLAEAEKAFDDAKKKREAVIKEFAGLKDALNSKPEGEKILQTQVAQAVDAARAAQQKAAAAPADQASKLADVALDKARSAAELLKDFKTQQDDAGGIDQAYGKLVANQMADSLAQIADAAAKVQEDVAQKNLTTMQTIVQNTVDQAAALKSLQVGFDTEAAKGGLQKILEELRAQAQANPVYVPMVINSGSLPKELDGYGALPKKASGGLMMGSGSDTSDNLLAWLSPGEFVVRAAAVRRYGANYFSQLNSMALPRFANGGAVSRLPLPSIASSSSSASLMHRGTFNFPGASGLELIGTSDVFDAMTAASLRLRKRR